MKNTDKVKAAVDALHAAVKAVDELAEEETRRRRALADAKDSLKKVMHAVYGDSGRVALIPNSDGAIRVALQDDKLKIDKIEAEVIT